ncbi:MAG: 2-C-methyl-D-erythritol 2,4-cyclodiphosphate synthase [Treponema sp.]|jgi:2-C-methyl-D-erythritol 2,4-cyclodiphosphate synthase|nr:2-C-methyl-D-erythritol 2,4-cyclodiphosphate synthase [Treponema sp.]
MIRVGLGTDLHRLVEGRRLLLAGVEIPSGRGEDAHSDGDVLAHAVIDAVLGAAALGDIGEFFPDTEAAYKNADSMMLLSRCWKQVQKEGWHLGNLDCVIVLETPKVLPYREKIRASLARALDSEAVFVKAKTAEGIGPLGEGAAIGAEAVCLLEK